MLKKNIAYEIIIKTRVSVANGVHGGVVTKPFNLVNAALITHMLAQQTGYKPGELIWMGMDTHIYLNHLNAVRTQIERAPKALPKLIIKRKAASFFDYCIEDFELDGYDPHPAIKAEVAV